MAYSSRKWLNPSNSSSFGNIVCYDDLNKNWDESTFRNTFIAISDCHNTVRLHKGPNDTIKDFITKLKKFNLEIDNFIKYLENQE